MAEELAGRFGLPLWRFCNSGTEATMDAVHLMRAVTGRDLIIKVEGCYHGHHDSVQVSVTPDAGDVGPAEPADERPRQHRHPRGHHGAHEHRSVQRPRRGGPAPSRSTPGEIAGMIIEPIMMNAGIILPAAAICRG